MMKKQTYKLIREAVQLMTVIVAVVFLTLGFYVLSRMLVKEPSESVEDDSQLLEMQSYHQLQGRANIIYFK